MEKLEVPGAAILKARRPGSFAALTAPAREDSCEGPKMPFPSSNVVNIMDALREPVEANLKK
ncbi:hypothetical protein ACU8NH_30795 (plasmid) [Rhizobium leguminosarum]